MRGIWLNKVVMTLHCVVGWTPHNDPSNFLQSTHNECTPAPFKYHSGDPYKLQQNWPNNFILIQQYSCPNFATNILILFHK